MTTDYVIVYQYTSPTYLLIYSMYMFGSKYSLGRVWHAFGKAGNVEDASERTHTSIHMWISINSLIQLVVLPGLLIGLPLSHYRYSI